LVDGSRVCFTLMAGLLQLYENIHSALSLFDAYGNRLPRRNESFVVVPTNMSGMTIPPPSTDLNGTIPPKSCKGGLV